jgi:hypothetical protein
MDGFLWSDWSFVFLHDVPPQHSGNTEPFGAPARREARAAFQRVVFGYEAGTFILVS